MGNQIIKIDNTDLYGVFSSISDDFICYGLTKEQIIDFFVEQAIWNAKDSAIRALSRLEDGSSVTQFTITHQEAIKSLSEDRQKELKEILESLEGFQPMKGIIVFLSVKTILSRLLSYTIISNDSKLALRDLFAFLYTRINLEITYSKTDIEELFNKEDIFNCIKKHNLLHGGSISLIDSIYTLIEEEIDRAFYNAK